MSVNRLFGWCFLVAIFVGAIGLDPWSLSERDPSVLLGSRRMFARHAQAVVAGMAFFQLLVARLLGERYPARVRRLVSRLSAAGALVYCLGYGLYLLGQAGAWLSIGGALVNSLALGALAGAHLRGQDTWTGRVVPMILCLGMLIDAMMALFAADPVLFLPGFIGAEDGVRLRMLRLARAAIIALLLLTLLYQDLADDGGAHGRLVRGGKLLLVIGAVGMPLTLCLAVFTWLGLKTFLAVPAVAIFAGVLAGIWLASRLKRPSEVWGWLLIAIAMAAGLFMGTYAFDGPSPTPDFLGAYNAFNRRLSRLAHGYAIILGLLSILLARELNAARIPSWPRRLGRVLVVAGSIVTVAGVLLQAIGAPPLPTLCVGPALVASGMVLCLLRSTFVKMDQPRP